MTKPQSELLFLLLMFVLMSLVEIKQKTEDRGERTEVGGQKGKVMSGE